VRLRLFWEREAVRRGKEERVPDEYIMVRPVRDHEEWTRLSRDAEGEVFIAQGFVVRDEKDGGYVTDPLAVEGALGVVAEHKGWPLADVGGPMVSGPKPAEADGFGTRMEGGWWLVVPADYLEDATHPDLEFHAHYKDREIVLWAFEAHVERFGGPKLLEFEHEVEFVLRGRTLYVHDDHPDELRRCVGS
jgi:hypothetical protein